MRGELGPRPDSVLGELPPDLGFRPVANGRRADQLGRGPGVLDPDRGGATEAEGGADPDPATPAGAGRPVEAQNVHEAVRDQPVVLEIGEKRIDLLSGSEDQALGADPVGLGEAALPGRRRQGLKP